MYLLGTWATALKANEVPSLMDLWQTKHHPNGGKKRVRSYSQIQCSFGKEKAYMLLRIELSTSRSQRREDAKGMPQWHSSPQGIKVELRRIWDFYKRLEDQIPLWKSTAEPCITDLTQNLKWMITWGKCLETQKNWWVVCFDIISRASKLRIPLKWLGVHSYSNREAA